MLVPRVAGRESEFPEQPEFPERPESLGVPAVQVVRVVRAEPVVVQVEYILVGYSAVQ